MGGAAGLPRRTLRAYEERREGLALTVTLTPGTESGDSYSEKGAVCVRGNQKKAQKMGGVGEKSERFDCVGSTYSVQPVCAYSLTHSLCPLILLP